MSSSTTVNEKDWLELCARVEALEANMNGIAWAFEQHAAKWNQNAESENLRQQDEDVERVAGDLQPVATDEELAACSADAAKVAILERRDYDKALTSADITKVQSRALYDLGRKHGATQATCPHIRSSDEGTSYCALAEQSANSKPTPNDLHLAELSPADQIMIAVDHVYRAHGGDPPARAVAAAVLAAAADQVVPEHTNPVGDEHDEARTDQWTRIRRDLLAIAAELGTLK